MDVMTWLTPGAMTTVSMTTPFSMISTRVESKGKPLFTVSV